MNRNANERFALNPVNIDMARSKFTMTPEVKTTFNLGEIFPIGAPIEVLPGDTFQVTLSSAIRMQSLVTSPFDNVHFDYYFFFVPSRLCWDHWKQFMGENTESAWIPTTEYTIPTLDFVGGAEPKSVADYFGIPTKGGTSQVLSDGHIKVNALPFRGFAEIFNEWFRDENIMDPVNINTDDVNRTGFALPEGATKDTYYGYDTVITDLDLGGYLPRACKSRDYFTSALPGPQKGPDVMIADNMPVYFGEPRDTAEIIADHPLKIPSVIRDTGDGTTLNPGRSTIGFVNGSTSSNLSRVTSTGNVFQPANWYVASNYSINQLRLAFQIQKLYEKEARSGSRYIELLKGHFGVTAPDASLQRPQYLGGRRIPININQVVQTSETNDTPQGNIAGYSLTSFSGNGDFIQSFTEHGYLYALGVCRRDAVVYQQGIHRMWTRKDKLDYYFPVLANIGEQPILEKEIYCLGDEEKVTNQDNDVFGYQEAWAEYRYAPSICTSEMRSNYPQSLDVWHLGDFYDTDPRLHPDWITEDPIILNRVIAVNDRTSDQFFGDFHFNITATRPMPLYSVPGLIDHH